MDLKHDGLVSISVGTRRTDTRWEVQRLSYSLLAERLSRTRRTSETCAEYLALGKSAQDGIKDGGGFVGGTLGGPRRLASAVVSRSLVTLDVDHAPPGFWEDVKRLQTFGIMMYSTHRHRPDAPRLRLIIPLSRPVTPDEYKAVSRWVAAEFGIECFDDTTFETNRLMYWPSTSKDGEYLFELLDLPWLDPDWVLSTYADWRDVTQWPVSSRVAAERTRPAGKAADPTGKRGEVGAFCREYGIHEAIAAFLTDVYAIVPGTGRYTYTAGSTTGGLVVYDDGRFAYSHHGTDPAQGHLLNAFDLVRVHRFGHLDADVKPGTPPNRLPSHAAMCELVRRDERISQAQDTERLTTAAKEFGEAPADDDPTWMSKLVRDQHGNISPTRPNLVRILENDPRLKGAFGYNLFTSRPSLVRGVFWNAAPAPWQDSDDAALRCYIEAVYGISSKDKLADALVTVMVRSPFHPVRTYIDSHPWDGTPRLETLLVDVMGAPDSEYTRAVTRKWFAGAVARVRNPGCQMDYMLVLKGKQGMGKSRFLATMCQQDPRWFSDTPVPFHDAKAVMEVTSGKWIVEMGEMYGFRRAEQEAIKRCITSSGESVRQAFGHYPGTFLRQCVFAGTTNRDDYIPDPTGGRRYWPVDVVQERITKPRETYLTPEIVGQIWAEAAMFQAAGERLFLPEELEAVAYERQQAHSLLDERGAQVREYLDRLLPADWYRLSRQDRILWLASAEHSDSPGTIRRDRVCAMEIWVECFGRRESDLERRNSQAITDIMMQFKDWDRGPYPVQIPGYGSTRVFLRTATTFECSSP